jgi:hypothetical protein
MKEVEKLNGCYSDFARFMFGTMIEIENALPKDTGRRNVNFIRAIVGVNGSLLSTLIPIYKISQFSFDLFVFFIILMKFAYRFYISFAHSLYQG